MKLENFGIQMGNEETAFHENLRENIFSRSLAATNIKKKSEICISIISGDAAHAIHAATNNRVNTIT